MADFDQAAWKHATKLRNASCGTTYDVNTDTTYTTVVNESGNIDLHVAGPNAAKMFAAAKAKAIAMGCWKTSS